MDAREARHGTEGLAFSLSHWPVNHLTALDAMIASRESAIQGLPF